MTGSGVIKHARISSAAVNSYRKLSYRIGPTVPIIIESVVPPEAIAEEVQMARAALGEDDKVFAASSF